MRNPNDSNYYYSEQKTNSSNKSSSERSLDDTMNPRLFIKRLIGLQVFSTSILFLVACLQGIAIGTNDWFVLNVNEYIPTAKGGLWFYCYIAANNYLGQYSCLKYEQLPNYAIFINSRLYDSRILLICSSGFCFIILVIEIFGIVCLIMANRRGDIIDSFVARRSSRWRLEKQPNEFLYPPTPKMRSKATQSSKLNGIEELTNSARFTTSIVINANNELTETYRTIKPTGYFAYLAISLVSLVGSVMDFVLKVSGFALFDAYIARLLLSNTVFLAFRSYSYWMMVASIVLTIIFWLFKVFSTRYVVNLTKKLLLNSNINFAVSPTSTESVHSDLNAYESPQTSINNLLFTFLSSFLVFLFIFLFEKITQQ